VTVRVPPSGIPPKADVYLLADTTGSMGTIIGAVQAGIGTIVTDPAFGGFDVAWGAGNYKDFPIPGSSPYAFQHPHRLRAGTRGHVDRRPDDHTAPGLNRRPGRSRGEADWRRPCPGAGRTVTDAPAAPCRGSP
jgi:hypothetical protein